LASTERWNVTSTVVTVGEERAGPAADDERDRLVDLRSERIGGFALARGGLPDRRVLGAPLEPGFQHPVGR
jgi:hypothetical protein